MNDRAEQINDILIQKNVDLDALRRYSRHTGGFINSRLRTRVWPKLLNINRYRIEDYRSYIVPHQDDPQISCDVERSLWTLSQIKFWKESQMERKRKALSDIIKAVLCRNKKLHYYQVFYNHYEY
jgi:hypothetical protein